MPPESLHHKSKKRRYSLLLVPTEDAGQAKTLKFAPWHVVLLSGSLVAIFIALVLLILVYTPVGLLVPIPNPELENKYSKELLSLNQRMNALMQELLVLRQYNLKLRGALGENVVRTDSGLILAGRVPPSGASDAKREQVGSKRTRPFGEEILSIPQAPLPVQQVRDQKTGVVFPALFPTDGYVTRGFDVELRHLGMDIAGKTGTPVYAAADGNVVFSGWTNEDGYSVILSHSGGHLTFYKHNQSLLKTANSYVRRGEPIALLGNSGETSQGPHLHFEIWKDGSPVDPSQYILSMHF